MSVTAITFLAFYIAGLGMALSRHPKWGLVVYMGTFYLHPPARWWGESLPGVRWSLVAATVTLLAYYLNRNRLHFHGPIFSRGIMRALILFTLWLSVQSAWALDGEKHMELVVLYWKYILLMYLFYRVIDTPEALRLILWVHVIGCFSMGWDAFTTYTGGRFEGFAPPNVNEANAGGLQLVTGLYTAGALFLAAQVREKVILTGAGAFIANGIVTTLSRSATLATGTGGLLFLLFTPSRHRKVVVVLAAIAAIGFISLTNPVYWMRIATIKQAGEQIEGVNTGYGRVVLMKAQMRMFREYPLGCGHRCTAFLSPYYLEERYLTGKGESRARSSHSTIMTLLVEQGIPGIIFYCYLLMWVFMNLRRLYKEHRDDGGLLPLVTTATAAALGAIFIGDLFVDYLKLEVRLWFITILLLLPSLWDKSYSQSHSLYHAPQRGGSATP